MPSYSSILLALVASAAAAPLAARSNVCGVAPSASSSSKAPLETLTTTTTADECLAKCSAKSGCESFLFGLVDGVIKCELFDVPASQIPTQDTTDLVAFDKACTSVPDVKPTTSNPQGLKTSTTKTTQSQPKESKASKASTKSTKGTKNTRATKQKVEEKKTETKAANTCGAAPAGSGSAQPIETPSNINSLSDCIAACKKVSSCKSVEFGKLTSKGADVCRFFSVAASEIPKATSGQSFQVSDVGC